MQAKLVRIGNSQGVRLPKAVIEQAGLGEELELEVVGNTVVIRPGRAVRQGWGEAAAACHQTDDDLVDAWDQLAGDGLES
jgi:antitoxin MazE